jgi:hypothetical protein
MRPFLCRFLDAGDDEALNPLMRRVQKAPRHEIAVGGAAAVPQALWGLSHGVWLGEVGLR